MVDKNLSVRKLGEDPELSAKYLPIARKLHSVNDALHPNLKVSEFTQRQADGTVIRVRRIGGYPYIEIDPAKPIDDPKGHTEFFFIGVHPNPATDKYLIATSRRKDGSYFYASGEKLSNFFGMFDDLPDPIPPEQAVDWRGPALTDILVIKGSGSLPRYASVTGFGNYVRWYGRNIYTTSKDIIGVCVFHGKLITVELQSGVEYVYAHTYTVGEVYAQSVQKLPVVLDATFVASRGVSYTAESPELVACSGFIFNFNKLGTEGVRTIHLWSDGEGSPVLTYLEKLLLSFSIINGVVTIFAEFTTTLVCSSGGIDISGAQTTTTTGGVTTLNTVLRRETVPSEEELIAEYEGIHGGEEGRVYYSELYDAEDVCWCPGFMERDLAPYRGCAIHYTQDYTKIHGTFPKTQYYNPATLSYSTCFQGAGYYTSGEYGRYLYIEGIGSPVYQSTNGKYINANTSPLSFSEIITNTADLGSRSLWHDYDSSGELAVFAVSTSGSYASNTSRTDTGGAGSNTASWSVAWEKTASTVIGGVFTTLATIMCGGKTINATLLSDYEDSTYSSFQSSTQEGSYGVYGNVIDVEGAASGEATESTQTPVGYTTLRALDLRFGMCVTSAVVTTVETTRSTSGSYYYTDAVSLESAVSCVRADTLHTLYGVYSIPLICNTAAQGFSGSSSTAAFQVNTRSNLYTPFPGVATIVPAGGSKALIYYSGSHLDSDFDVAVESGQALLFDRGIFTPLMSAINMIAPDQDLPTKCASYLRFPIFKQQSGA